MKSIDLKYVCTVIGNLSGIPIRLYEGGELLFYHAIVDLPKDPMNVYKKEIFDIKTHIGSFVTPIFNYYGIVNSEPYKIVIGPSRHVAASDNDLRELAFRADVEKDDMDKFLASMKSIVNMPLDSVMQMLCVVNHVLNGENLTLRDIRIYDDSQTRFDQIIEGEHAKKQFEDTFADPQNPHNSLAVEQTILSFVRKGDSKALKDWLVTAPAVRPGVLSENHLRQIKNTFIVTATLVSRSGISGGMEAEDALSLSDSYIQKSELMNRADDVNNLMYHMVIDFTERVERLRVGTHISQLTLSVANYVQKHISEAISTEEMANTFFMSRPYLSKKFKEETGVTLTDFILNEKVREAKRLLTYTDKSLIAISVYLGFSSQSHFARVFKKYAGISPSDYREKHSS